MRVDARQASHAVARAFAATALAPAWCLLGAVAATQLGLHAASSLPGSRAPAQDGP